MKKIIEVLILVSSLMMIISCENMAKDPTAEYIVNTETTEEPSENPTETPTEEEENVPSWIANKIDGSDFVKYDNLFVYEKDNYTSNYISCNNKTYEITSIEVIYNNSIICTKLFNYCAGIISRYESYGIKIDISKIKDIESYNISITNETKVYLEKITNNTVNIVIKIN